MKKLIALAMLIALSTTTFAATKAVARNVKPQPSSTGIMFANFFYFNIVGDGISTSFTIDPRKIPPQYTAGGSTYPHLPLLGVLNNGYTCGSFAYVATLSDGLLTLTFATAPPANNVQQCGVWLVFQPE